MTATHVLIHGGSHGAWAWESVLPRLPKGTIAVDLPGRGLRKDVTGRMTLELCADAVVADIEAAGLGDVVLVGHSMAGMIIPIIARRLGDRVTATVHLSALVPLVGESVLTAGFPSPFAAAAAAASRRLPRLRTTGPRWVTRRRFCNDLPRERHAEILDRLCPDWVYLTGQRAPDSLVDQRARPGVYVQLLRDRQLPPESQARMAARLLPSVQLVTLDAGHDAMISDPAGVADAIRSLPLGEAGP